MARTFDSQSNFQQVTSGLRSFRTKLKKAYSAGAKSFDDLAWQLQLDQSNSDGDNNICLFPLSASADLSSVKALSISQLTEARLGEQSIFCSASKAFNASVQNPAKFFPTKEIISRYAKYLKEKQIGVDLKRRLTKLKSDKQKINPKKTSEIEKIDREIRKISLSISYADFFAKDGTLLANFYDSVCERIAPLRPALPAVPTPVPNIVPPEIPTAEPTNNPPVNPTNPPVEPTNRPIDPTNRPIEPTNPPATPTFLPTSQTRISAPQILAPTTLTTSRNVEGKVVISWSAPVYAAKYLIRAEDLSDPSARYTGFTNGAVYMLVDNYLPTNFALPVVPGHQYHFWVHAITANFNYQNTSTWSLQTNLTFTVNNDVDLSTPTPTIAPTATATPDLNPTGLVSSTSWVNQQIADQNSSFRISFNAIPLGSNIDALTGFSIGNSSSYDSLGPIVRFNASGAIDARNGDNYQTLNQLNYVQNKVYSITMDIHLLSRVYSVSVTDDQGQTTQIANGFAFRTSLSSATHLNNLGIFAASGSHRISGISNPVVIAGPTPLPTTVPGACGAVPNGGTATRVKYLSATVATGQSCQNETQIGLCLNGVLGAWTGTYLFDECTAPGGNDFLNMRVSGSSRIYDSPAGGPSIVFGKNVLNTTTRQVVLEGAAEGEPTEQGNQVLFNTTIDGYGGHPLGSCPSKAACPNALNNPEALIMLWGANRVIKNILIKNVEAKNAGYWVDTHDHVDVFQSYTALTPSWAEKGYIGNGQDWFVIQDSIFKNSDHNTMISEMNMFKGVVYQNLKVIGHEPLFQQDCEARARGMGLDIRGCVQGNKRISAGYPWRPDGQARTSWMINIVPPAQSAGSVEIDSNNAAPQTNGNVWGPIILVGPQTKNFQVNTNFQESYIDPADGKTKTRWKAIVRDVSTNTPSQSSANKVYRYNTIEEALAAGHPRPPMIELSCSGWANPPPRCTNGIGPKVS